MLAAVLFKKCTDSSDGVTTLILMGRFNFSRLFIKLYNVTVTDTLISMLFVIEGSNYKKAYLRKETLI